jgi:hypothetical protein
MRDFTPLPKNSPLKKRKDLPFEIHNIEEDLRIESNYCPLGLDYLQIKGFFKKHYKFSRDMILLTYKI